MDLREKIREILIEKIKEIDMLSIYDYHLEDKKIIKNLYKLQIIDDKQIESALEKGIINQARKDYELIIKERGYTIWADHVGHPEYLAYALENGEFSKKEIKKIPFDHGENAKTFSKYHGRKDLISFLKLELFNPKPLPKIKSDYCRCEGHCCNY